MAYTDNQKSTGLDLLTDLTITQSDLHIVGDVSDSGRAKAITQNLLEDYIANSDNFINELTANSTFITNIGTITPSSSLDVQENGVSVENPVDTINFVTNGGIVSTPLAGVVDVDLTSLLSGGGGTLVASDTTQSTVTNSSNTYTTRYTIPIPGGTLGTGNVLRVSLLNTSFSGSSGSGNYGILIKYGGVQVAEITSNDTGVLNPNQFIDIVGIIAANNSTGSQKSVFTATNEYVVKTDGSSSISVDSTINQDLTIETKGQSGGSMTQIIEGIVIEKISSNGSAGNKIATSSTQVVSNGTTPVTLYTIPIPPNTLGSDNGIRYKLLFSQYDQDASASITFTATYGGTTIGTVSTGTNGVAFSGGDADIVLEGTILANAATNAQIGNITCLSRTIQNIGGNVEIPHTRNDYGTAAVDSTVSQNLVLSVVTTSAASVVTVEGIIVEKIS